LKTKNFIKNLQKIDPSGELHVSGIDGGALTWVERLSGYYDGPGVYTEDDKFIIDYLNEKIVIHTEDEDDFIWNNEGDYSNIVVKTDSKDCKKEYEEKFKKISEEYKNCHNKQLYEQMFKVLKRLKEGYSIYQSKEDRGKYHGVFYVLNGHDFKRTHGKDIYKDGSDYQEILCQGEVEVLKESGFFVEEEGADYITWRLSI
jgi:hypothetical protein